MMGLSMKKVGVLALQGAFREHKQALERLGVITTEIRLVEQLEHIDGLIIPGGESTTITKLIAHYGFDSAIPAFHHAGKAVWGTCAGAIVIAKEIVGHPEQPRLNLLDMCVARNAYGRQVASFETPLAIAGFAEPFTSIFIRAPRIVNVEVEVEVLASYEDDPILVRQGKLLASVFHPELSGDDRLHQYFVKEVIS